MRGLIGALLLAPALAVKPVKDWKDVETTKDAVTGRASFVIIQMYN